MVFIVCLCVLGRAILNDELDVDEKFSDDEDDTVPGDQYVEEGKYAEDERLSNNAGGLGEAEGGEGEGDGIRRQSTKARKQSQKSMNSLASKQSASRVSMQANNVDEHEEEDGDMDEDDGVDADGG